MKASVFENGRYDQKVGKNNNEANGHAQSDDHVVTSAPVGADVLATLLIEEFDGAVVVASLFVRIDCIHAETAGG